MAANCRSALSATPSRKLAKPLPVESPLESLTGSAVVTELKLRLPAQCWHSSSSWKVRRISTPKFMVCLPRVYNQLFVIARPCFRLMEYCQPPVPQLWGSHDPPPKFTPGRNTPPLGEGAAPAKLPMGFC